MRSQLPKDPPTPRKDAPYGRDAELSELVATAAPGAAPLLVIGDPGVGKTHLLRMFAAAWEAEHGGKTHWFNAAHIPPDPRAVRTLLEAVNRKAASRPGLVVLDNFDAHARMELAYRDRLLPLLGEGFQVALGSVTPLVHSWEPQKTPWRHPPHALHLAPLSPEAASAFLADHGVPEAHRPSLVGFTGGSPLLLTTLLEFARTAPETEWFRPDPRRSPVEAILSHVLQEAPSEEHRRGLWAMSLPDVLSQRLLAGMLDHPRSNEVYRWLRTRRYVNATAGGLAIHRLFRGPLLDDLMQRSQHLYREFLLRAGRYFVARAAGQKQAKDRRAAATAQFYLQRRQYLLSARATALSHSPLYVDDFVDPTSGDERDERDVSAIVSRFEDAAGAAIAHHWRKRFPDQLQVFRGSDGRVQAFLQTIRLEHVDADDLTLDPVMQRVQQLHQRQIRRRRSHRVHGRQRSARQTTLVFRHWFDADEGQKESIGRAEVVREMVMQLLALARPGLTLLVAPESDPGFTRGLENVGLVWHFDDAHVRVGTRLVELVGHDFVDEPLELWLRRALTSAISGTRRPPTTHAQTSDMDRQDFYQAVVAALENYFDEEALARNPLARRLADKQDLPPESRLQTWLLDGLSQLARMPGGDVYAARLRERFMAQPAHPKATRDEGLLAAIQLLVATLWDSRQGQWAMVS